jgi:class III poly(R)-hydroxyalkanoic acid synthase PhaE subunit
MTTNPFTAWANHLLEYQRTYQDAWQALAAQPNARGFDAVGNDSNPWVAALEQWWKTAQLGTTPPVQDFYTRLVEQGKVYFQMSDGLNKALQEASALGESAARWQEAVNNTVSGLKDMFGGQKAAESGAVRQAIGFWELPLKTWQRAVSSSSVLPGDFLQHINALGVGRVRDEIHGRVDQLLSTPAIGYMRENQEQTQTLAKLIIDYQQALHDYVATYGEIGIKCVETLQQHVQRRAEEGKSVGSLRDMYDLWVDSCEEAYGEYVSTDEYVEIYGSLVNSLMAVKRHGTMMVDEVLGALNMPTRAEIDTLHLRLQEARREGKALRAELESLRQLGVELSALKAKLLDTGNSESTALKAKASQVAGLRGTTTARSAAKKPSGPKRAGGKRRPASSNHS